MRCDVLRVCRHLVAIVNLNVYPVHQIDDYYILYNDHSMAKLCTETDRCCCCQSRSGVSLIIPRHPASSCVIHGLSSICIARARRNLSLPHEDLIILHLSPIMLITYRDTRVSSYIPTRSSRKRKLMIEKLLHSLYHFLSHPVDIQY